MHLLAWGPGLDFLSYTRGGGGRGRSGFSHGDPSFCAKVILGPCSLLSLHADPSG